MSSGYHVRRAHSAYISTVHSRATVYDAESSRSLRLLAAHVYYRALLTVPSLVRSWWLELKDRQLSTAVTSYTSSYFSPVLIASELSHVKPSSRAAAAARDESLADESFSVKVALAVNEVTATFNVDEQQMEIGVRLPAEYPLRAVEVRDIRRVGVRDNLWRKWLFAVQQVVTSQVWTSATSPTPTHNWLYRTVVLLMDSAYSKRTSACTLKAKLNVLSVTRAYFNVEFEYTLVSLDMFTSKIESYALWIDHYPQNLAKRARIASTLVAYTRYV